MAFSACSAGSLTETPRDNFQLFFIRGPSERLPPLRPRACASPPEFRHRGDSYPGTRAQCTSSPSPGLSPVLLSASSVPLAPLPPSLLFFCLMVRGESCILRLFNFDLRVVSGSRAIFSRDRCMLGRGWPSLPPRVSVGAVTSFPKPGPCDGYPRLPT